MSIAVFGGDGFSVNTTPLKVVDSADFDRTVLISPTNETVVVGLDDTDGFGMAPGGGSNSRYTQFVLPADEEVWLWTTTGSTTASVLVSK